MKNINIAYPILAMSSGPILLEDQDFEIEKLSGILLDYAAAIASPLSSEITVHFHPSLKQITRIYINNTELWEPMNNENQLNHFNLNDGGDVKNNSEFLRNAIRHICGEKIYLTFPFFMK
ncbi:hypothetical protein NUK36_04070 [Aeromonas hydrophila]|uniref:hypothetical protein n=1 Tax=Aeromonas hydrophila TaxID=644 RepID=UPI00214DDBC5|nr:hypothetical protein [Aeromonas hydrophila]MCR3902000.1 hypothetical protein [Aeromonas hydrophila]